MRDMLDEITGVHREVGRRDIPAGDARRVLLRRHYDAPPEDVWDACTNPERIKRWFLPVTGDLRVGGRYQLEGQAGGEILRCEPPRVLTITWVFAPDPGPEDINEVEIRLSPSARGGTDFELDHAAVVDPRRWAEYGPGAVGVGWDLALLGLSIHVRGETIADPGAWEVSPEAKALMAESSRAWGAANVAAGSAQADADAAARRTTAFYHGASPPS